MNILLVVNTQKDPDLLVTKRVIALIGNRAKLYMEESYREYSLENVTYLQADDIYSGVDLVLVLGGDGTILSVAERSANWNKPVLGINLDRLGFLVDIEQNEIEAGLDKLFAGEYILDERVMLRAELAGGKSADALNDIVVTRANSSLKILELDIFIDDEYVDDFKADGIMISTPTGSTAYSLSAGGPIVDPSLESMIVTPICPHKMYSRAIIVPANKTVTVQCKTAADNEAIVAADSQILGELLENDSITIKISPKRLSLIRLQGYQFFGALRKKLLKKES